MAEKRKVCTIELLCRNAFPISIHRMIVSHSYCCVWQANDIEVVESVYSFLVSSGHAEAAKAFAKEAKLNEKKAKATTAPALLEVFFNFK